MISRSLGGQENRFLVLSPCSVQSEQDEFAQGKWEGVEATLGSVFPQQLGGAERKSMPPWGTVRCSPCSKYY